MSRTKAAFKKGALVNAISLALITQVYAQDTTDENVRELDMTVVEADSITRDAVVTEMDVGDMNEIQVDNFEDMVRYIPGVSVSRGDDRWGGSGFNIRGLDEDRVAINIDGIPQGETLKYESGQAYGYFKGSRNGTDVETLKTTEIVKGADAIFSGSGSLAGAVNMTTRDPADFLSPEGDDWGFGLKSDYSSVNDETLVSLVGANRTGNLESMIQYIRRDGHEFENYDMDGADIDGSAREIPDPQDVEQESVLAKLVYNISPGQRIGLVGSYFDRNIFTDNRSFNGGWYSDRRGDDVSETQRVGIFHELEADTLLFDTISTTLDRQEVAFEANTSQHVEILVPEFPAFNTIEDRLDERSYDQDLVMLNIDLVKNLEAHEILYGLEWQDKEYENTQFRTADDLTDSSDEWVTENLGALVPYAEADVYTLYAMDAITLSGTTRMRVGLRYDDYSYDAMGNENYNDDANTLAPISFDAVTWTLGIEQGLSQALTLEAGVSTGFRAPTIEEMYRTSGEIDDWGTVANPDLGPEYSTNYDIALVGNYGPGKFRLGLFYSQYDDFIDSVQVDGINTNTGQPDPDGYSMPANSNEVEMQGVELEVNLDLHQAFGWSEGLTTNITGAYTEGEEKDGDPVYSVQPPNLIWDIAYQDPVGKWGVNFYTSFTAGKKNSDSYDTQPDGSREYPLYLSNTATVFDLIAYVDVMENLRISGGIYNLTDKEYYQWDSVRFIDQGDLRPGIGVEDDGIKRYSESGRNFELSVNYQF